MSDEWFAFHGPPKVADSLPDNKIVQGLSNFNSFHWLTTIKTTGYRNGAKVQTWFCHGLFFAWDVLTLLHPLCSRAGGTAPGPPTSPQLPPNHWQHWHHMQKKHSVCRTAAPSSSWEAFGTVRCLEAGFRQLQP